MGDMPERITATFDNWRNPNAGAAYRNDAGRDAYIRADLYTAAIARAERAEAERDALARALIAAEALEALVAEVARSTGYMASDGFKAPQPTPLAIRAQAVLAAFRAAVEGKG